MRKITLFFALILLANMALAQETRSFRFGLKASPNISWMKPDATGLQAGSPRLKFSYGLMTEFFMSDNYIFSTGLDVLGTGGYIEFNPNTYYAAETEAGNADFRLERRTYNLQYINLPLLIKMRTNEIGYMRYFGQFGIDAGFRTRARANDRGFVIGEPLTRSNVDILDDVQFFRMALNLGLGIEYNLVGNTNLLVSANYSNAFTNNLRSTSKHIRRDLADPQTLISQKAFANFVALNVGIFF